MAGLAVLAIVLLAAGCSGGSGKGLGTSGTSGQAAGPASEAPSTAAPDTTDFSSDFSNGPDTTEPSTTTTPPTTQAPKPTLPPDEGDHGPEYFMLPSGNIGCFLSAGAARCDVADKTWTAPPPAQPCDLDYGHGATLSAGQPPVFTCAGDTTLGGPETLGYGSSAQRGKLRCDASQAGITCTDLSTGHAFFLSRDSYRFS